MALSSGSSQLPAGLHATRQASANRGLIIVVAAVALLVGAAWWSQRPLARIPLPDGGKLLLVQAHYGPTFDYSETVGFLERFKEFVSDSKSITRQPNVVHFGDESTPPRLWLVFDGRHAENSQPGGWFIDRVETIESGLMIGETEQHRPRNSTQRRQIVELANYPRRASRFEVRIFRGRQIIHAAIPNPFPIKDTPSWTPEPLPQTRKLPSREIVLRNVSRSSMEAIPGEGSSEYFTIGTEIEVREPGVPLGAFDLSHSASDATGNVSATCLPAGESAWKIHVTVKLNERYPFPASEIVPLGRITIPAPGECSVLPVSANATLSSARFMVLAGPGEYRMHFGGEPKIEPFQRQSGRPAVPAEGKARIIKCLQPELRIYGEGNVPAAFNPDIEPLLRAAVGTGYIALPFRRNEPGMGFWMKRFGFGRTESERPRPGTELEIQFIVPHLEEIVDFFVQPPS